MTPVLPPALSAGEFERFRRLIHDATGITLGDSKRTLLVARLGKRLRHLRLESFADYWDYLAHRDPEGRERVELVNSITTNKTDFFRERHHFDFVRDVVVPEARVRAAGAAGATTLALWSSACSTGEEPYSLAMTMRDALGDDRRIGASILATDIDTDVLGRATAGVYAEERIAEVPADVRHRHFLRGRDAYAGAVRVRPEVRRLVTFRQLNLVGDAWPVEGSFDVIFCRNVIIYFTRETQRRLFERLARHLAPHGYLMVGHSETLHWLADLFEPVGPTIYRRRRR